MCYDIFILLTHPPPAQRKPYINPFVDDALEISKYILYPNQDTREKIPNKIDTSEKGTN